MNEIVIIGCGTMGHSIALNAAWAKFNVTVVEKNIQKSNQGRHAIINKLTTLHNHGIIKGDELKDIQNRITMSSSIENNIKNTNFIIEAIHEDISSKKEIFRTIESYCNPDTIIASNTSGLNPTDIFSDMTNPKRAIILHFWNPAHLIPLVEIVPGNETSDETVNVCFKIMRTMQKKPIKTNKYVPGFVGNRLQYALFREAQYLLELGIVSKQDIDDVVTYGIGRRLPVTGPLISADMGGLDVFYTISNYLFNDLSSADTSLPYIQDLFKKGHLGEKTGMGFYQWSSNLSKLIHTKREEELIHFLKQDIKKEHLKGDKQ